MLPRKITFGIQENACNLSCPKCLVHSPHYPKGKEIRKQLGKMDLDNIIKTFDEIASWKPVVSPSYWSEPLFNKKLFMQFVQEATKRGIPVEINTNALLIDTAMAKFLLDNISTISISIDALKKETLLKTRSVDCIEKINNAVELLLQLRGNKLKPRMVVSFTEEDANMGEKNDFIQYWIGKVDAVRVNKAYNDLRKVNPVTITRIPCREIYDCMNIDYDGTVRICCLDAYRQTDLGNVFREGVLNVWNGKKYRALRESHEGDPEKIDPFCKGCDQWAGFNIIEEREVDGMLIRCTLFSSYYNRIDRLHGWKSTRMDEHSLAVHKELG